MGRAIHKGWVIRPNTYGQAVRYPEMAFGGIVFIREAGWLESLLWALFRKEPQP